jgi:hypothetical protein
MADDDEFPRGVRRRFPWSGLDMADGDEFLHGVRQGLG